MSIDKISLLMLKLSLRIDHQPRKALLIVSETTPSAIPVAEHRKIRESIWKKAKESRGKVSLYCWQGEIALKGTEPLKQRDDTRDSHCPAIFSSRRLVNRGFEWRRPWSTAESTRKRSICWEKDPAFSVVCILGDWRDLSAETSSFSITHRRVHENFEKSFHDTEYKVFLENKIRSRSVLHQPQCSCT